MGKKKEILLKDTDVTNEYAVTIHGQLAAARKMRGLSQEDLGKLIGMARVSITNVERGDKNISIKRLQKACDVLGFKVMLIPVINHKIKIKRENETKQYYKQRAGAVEFELPRPGEPDRTDDKIEDDSGSIPTSIRNTLGSGDEFSRDVLP